MYHEKSNSNTYKDVNNCEKLHMRNTTTTNIKCVGDVVMKMTLGKDFKLRDILHVPTLHKRLIFIIEGFGFL